MGKKGKRKTERDKEKPAVYIEPESKGLSLYDVKRKLQITQRLIQKKDIKKMFSSPITDTAAPGYSQIIAKPMDFYTINKKVSTESYAIFRDYMTDVALVLQNCMTYNMGDTPYYKYAAKLAPVFEKIFEKELGMKFTIVLPPPRSEPILLRDIIPGYESSEDDEKPNGEQDSSAGEEDAPDENVSETQSEHVSSEVLPKEEEELPNGEVYDNTTTDENQPQSPQESIEEPVPMKKVAEAPTTEMQLRAEKHTLAQSSACNESEDRKSFITLPLNQNQPSPVPRLLDVSLPLEVDTEQNSDRVSVSSDVSKTSGFSLASSSLQTPSTPTKQRKPFKRKKKSDMYEFVDEDIPQKPFNDIPGKSKLSIEDILNMSSETCGENEDPSFNAEVSAPADKPCSPIQFSDGEENVTSQGASCPTNDISNCGNTKLESNKNDEKLVKEASNCETEVTLAEGSLQEPSIESVELSPSAVMSAQLQKSSNSASIIELPVNQHISSTSTSVESVDTNASSSLSLDIQASSNESILPSKKHMLTPVSLNSNIESVSNVASVPPITVVNSGPDSTTDQSNASQISPGVIKKRRGRPKLDRSKISAGYSRPQPVSPAVVVKTSLPNEDVSAKRPTSTQNVSSDLKNTPSLVVVPETSQTSMPDLKNFPNAVPDADVRNSVPDSEEAPKIFPNFKSENQVPNFGNVNCIPELTAEELQIDESQTMMIQPPTIDMGPSSPQFQFGESLDNQFCDSETPLIIDQSSCDRSILASKNPFNDNVLEIPLSQIDSSETLAAVAAISSDETQESTANLGVNSADFNMHVESCAKPLEVVTHMMPQNPSTGTTQVNACYHIQQNQPNVIDSIDQVQSFTEDLNLSSSGSATVSSSLSDLAALLVSPQMTNVSGCKNTSLNSLECSFGFGLSPSTLSLTPSTNVSLNFETSPTKMFDDLICCIDTPQKSTPPISSNLAAISALQLVPFIGQHQETPDKTNLKRPANPIENEEPASKVAKETHCVSGMPEEQCKVSGIFNNADTEETPLYEAEVPYSIPFDKLMETPLAGSYELPLGYLKNGGIQKEVRFLPTTPCLEKDIVLSKDCFITKCDIDEDVCRLKTYSYLSYGSHGHYAPDKEVCEETYTLPSEKDILHSVYSGPVGLQFAESLQKFSSQMNPYMKRVVDEFLNSLTDEKHSLYQNKQLLSLPMEDSDNLSISQKEIKQLRTLKKLGIDVSFLDETKPENDRSSKSAHGNTESSTPRKQSLPKIQTVSSIHPETSQEVPESCEPETISVNTTNTLSELSNDANSNSLPINIPLSSGSNVSPRIVPSSLNSFVTNVDMCNYSPMNFRTCADTQYLDSMSGNEKQNQAFLDSEITTSQFEQHNVTNVSCSSADLDTGCSMLNSGSSQLSISTCQSDLGYASNPIQNVTMNGPGYTITQATSVPQKSPVKPPTTTALIKLPPISQFNESLSRSKNERNLKLKEPSLAQNFTVDHDKLERPKSATCIAPSSDFKSTELYFHNPRSAPNIGDKMNYSAFPGILQNNVRKELFIEDMNCTSYAAANAQSNAVNEPMVNNTSPGYFHTTATAAPFVSEVVAVENSDVSISVPCTTSTSSSNTGFYTNSAIPNLYPVYENSITTHSEEVPPQSNQVLDNPPDHQSSLPQQQMCNGYSSEFSAYCYPSQNENVLDNLEGAGHPAVQSINVFFENPKSSNLDSVEDSLKATHDASSNVLEISDEVSASAMSSTWESTSQQYQMAEGSSVPLDPQPQDTPVTHDSEGFSHTEC